MAAFVNLVCARGNLTSLKDRLPGAFRRKNIKCYKNTNWYNFLVEKLSTDK